MSFLASTIQKNLKCLSEKYDEAINSSRSNASLEAALYSKMALIELCGWIEETVDVILIDYINRNVESEALRKLIRTEIIERVYGFRYGQEFRPLVEKIIGAYNFQKIISRLHKIRGRDDVLKNQLANLAKERNRAAHTHWHAGTTPHFNAPSFTIQNFKTVCPILRSVERMIKNM